MTHAVYEQDWFQGEACKDWFTSWFNKFTYERVWNPKSSPLQFLISTYGKNRYIRSAEDLLIALIALIEGIESLIIAGKYSRAVKEVISQVYWPLVGKDMLYFNAEVSKQIEEAHTKALEKLQISLGKPEVKIEVGTKIRITSCSPEYDQKIGVVRELDPQKKVVYVDYVSREIEPRIKSTCWIIDKVEVVDPTTPTSRELEDQEGTEKAKKVFLVPPGPNGCRFLEAYDGKISYRAPSYNKAVPNIGYIGRQGCNYFGFGCQSPSVRKWLNEAFDKLEQGYELRPALGDGRKLTSEDVSEAGVEAIPRPQPVLAERMEKMKTAPERLRKALRDAFDRHPKFGSMDPFAKIEISIIEKADQLPWLDLNVTMPFATTKIRFFYQWSSTAWALIGSASWDLTNAGRIGVKIFNGVLVTPGVLDKLLNMLAECSEMVVSNFTNEATNDLI